MLAGPACIAVSGVMGAARQVWYVAAQIQNLFNKDYETAYSYNSSGRGAYVTVGWQQQ